MEKKHSLRIGIDLMGSESSPLTFFCAILKAAYENLQAVFILFVDSFSLNLIQSHHYFISLETHVQARFEFFLVDEVILMTDEPIKSLKEKKECSLIQALKLLKKNLLHVFIYAGNTGALIAGAALYLPLIGSIKRPALLTTLPTAKNKVIIIDVGGNVSCRASHLIQFAQMGVAYHQACSTSSLTRVGLLNVGVESKKGTVEIRKVYDYFQQEEANFPHMQFIGNLEGREVFQGEIDVLITDGFVGNVLLKTAEGIYSLISQQLERTLHFLQAHQKDAVLQSLRVQFDHEEHRGAIVCGVDGIIVKCHGHVSERGIYHAVCGAIELVENKFLEKMKSFS